MTDRISLQQDALTAGRTALDDAMLTIRHHVGVAQRAAADAAPRWRGSSGAAAQSLVREWSAEMERLAGSLDRLGSALRAAERDQEATEHRATGTLGDLAALMGAR